MFTVDTSVLVAGCVSWHERHDSAADALRQRPILIGHCLVETYSVLTRLPHPQRVDAPAAAAFLASVARLPPVQLDADALALVPSKLAAIGISGGATYDAVIALTAASSGMEMVTLDQRAAATYGKLGVTFRLL